MIYQWGLNNTTGTINFPITFNKCTFISKQYLGTDTGQPLYISGHSNNIFFVSDVTKIGFVNNYVWGDVIWFAIGY